MSVSGLKRVVITGLGPVTPIGVGAQADAQAQRAGQSGIATITHFDPADTASRIAGEVNADLSPFVDPREARKLDRYVQLALAAAALAVGAVWTGLLLRRYGAGSASSAHSGSH